jgi:hypothetical protein|tara:strand:+ start:22456 stop:22707 length:252 start_codon:yes stop_codon:yes gene_type:complete
MKIVDIKNAMIEMSQSELSQIINIAQQIKSISAQVTFNVGDSVWVVQKTKRTSGIIEKMNSKKAVVSMRGSKYNVPFTMLEAA